MKLAFVCFGAPLLLATLALPASACRCAPRPLADYFAEAEIVFLGRVKSVLEEAEEPAHRVVHFEVQQAFKGAPASLFYLTTALSTATCGVPAQAGESYVVFAVRRPEDARLARFDTCNGTRLFDPNALGSAQGFVDVAPAQVLERLGSLGAQAPGERPTAPVQKENP